MDTHRISVKELVTFLYSNGDLESQTRLKNAQHIGQIIHRERQDTYLEEDQKEVFVETLFSQDNKTLHITGRIDGLLKRDDSLVIEEIKSTATDLSLIKDTTFPAHMMQAKMYAYIYCETKRLKSITIWLTYVHHETQAVKTIQKRMQISQLKKTFEKTVDAYLNWLDILTTHQADKQKSLEGLTFPFDDYREGQYHFMGAIYQTLIKKDVLFATAPTGIGKTIAAIFSALKTLKNDQEKVFYLTAKNAGKTIAVDTVERLKAHGLKIKAITLNAKDNMCLQKEVDCDPDICPYAKGFYNRLRPALQDIFVHDDVYDAHLIKQYGEFHTICPHEFALEISHYSDIVICDYNYVFDPRIKLIRYFEDTFYKPKLLIDEAHNIIDRSRMMYSAALSDTDIRTLKVLAHNTKPAFKKAVDTLLNTMRNLIETTDINKTGFIITDQLEPTLLTHVHHLLTKLDAWLEANKKHPKRKAIRDHYFLLVQFMRISEYFDEAFRFTLEKASESVLFSIMCLDASKPVSEIINTASHGTVLFSATLHPIDYTMQLITRGAGQYFEVPSPFNPTHLGLFVDATTSTKYRDRTLSVTRIIDTIYAMLESKTGNYIVFFPSYQYMNMVLEVFDATGYSLMQQTRDMSLFERTTFIETFKAPSKQSKILFSVLGGSFSEGVDYVGETLSGVLIVGVALPALSVKNNHLKDYFYAQGVNGFDYAYTFPGMNKVIQAVGRVIRTHEDKGIAILLDTRYATPKYKQLMPSHWQPRTIEEDDYMVDYLNRFWDTFKLIQ